MVTSQRSGADNRAGSGKRKGNASRMPERPSGPVLYNFRRPDKFSKDHIRSIQDGFVSVAVTTNDVPALADDESDRIETPDIEQISA